MTSRHVLARSAVIDHVKGDLFIDGVRLPWYLAPTPTVDWDEPILEVSVTFLVDGVVAIRNSAGVTLHDPSIGAVGAWARDYVRTQLAARLPWLTLEHR